MLNYCLKPICFYLRLDILWGLADWSRNYGVLNFRAFVRFMQFKFPDQNRAIYIRVGHCKYYDFVYTWPLTKFGSKIDIGKLYLQHYLNFFLAFHYQILKMNLLVIKSHFCEIHEDSTQKYFFILYFEMVTLPFFFHAQYAPSKLSPSI